MDNIIQYGGKNGIYMGSNTCYINSSFQLLTTIPEFNNIFLTNEKYDDILYIGETVYIIKDIITERIKKNQNMAQFFEDVEQIVKYIINGTSTKDVNQCFKDTVYKTLIGTPNEICGFQSARDLINNFIDILRNLYVSNTSLNEKIQKLINGIIINKKEIKRCASTKEIKQNIISKFNVLEIKAPENTNLQQYINEAYNHYNLQEKLLEGCGNKQNIIDIPIAKLNSLNNITKCKNQVCGQKKKFCINKNDKYYNEYLKQVFKHEKNYRINAIPKTDCNGRKLVSIPYGDAIFGEHELIEEIAPNKYIIITLPMELYGTNNRTLYINYQGKINITNIEYILQGSIFHTGNHYVYQTYDGIGGTTVVNTYDDSSVLAGNANYIGIPSTSRNTAILLYKRKDIDIKLLQNGTKPSDGIIDQVVNEYCNYRNQIKIYGNIFNGINTTYSIYLGKYPDALLIINDNYKNSKTDKPGGGNASDQIRKRNIYSYKKYNFPKPYIAGITTGPYGPYNIGTTLNTKLAELDDKTPKEVIDEEIKLIKYIMIVWGYKEIIYSSDINGELGSYIFTIPPDIKEYITKQILNLGMKCYFIKDGKKTMEKISKNKYINILN